MLMRLWRRLSVLTRRGWMLGVRLPGRSSECIMGSCCCVINQGDGPVIGIPLLNLTIAMAPFVPSEAAAPHACREWRLAREAWLAAIEELQMAEDDIRKLAAYRIAVAEMPKGMQ
jgi:hypothetical protein